MERYQPTRADIVHEAAFDQTPEQVWEALTRPGCLGAWLMETTYAGREGGQVFEFRDRPRRPFWDGVVQCTVTEATPGCRFALSWGAGGTRGPSAVSWDRSPRAEGGTHVVFRRSGLAGALGWFMKKGMTAGWKRRLDRRIPYVLEQLAEARSPRVRRSSQVGEAQPGHVPAEAD